MMSSQPDAISYAQQLEAAGVPKNQAEVHARILADVLGKLVAFPRDLATVETKLESKIEASEARMINRIELVETKLLSRIESGEARLQGEITLLKWMTGTSIALNIGVLLKLLMP